MTRPSRDGDVGLSWDVSEQISGARLHAVHEGDGVFAVHVVHDVEVTHLIAGGSTAGGKTQRKRGEYSFTGGYTLVSPVRHLYHQSNMREPRPLQ